MKSFHGRIHLGAPLRVGERRNLALLLEDYDIPFRCMQNGIKFRRVDFLRKR